MNTRKDNNFLCANQKKKKQMLRSQSKTQKYYFFVNPIIIHLPIKKNTTTWKEKTKPRRFWLDLPPSHEMTSTCSSYLPICSPQKKIRIFFSKIPKFCGKKHNFSQCSTYVERQKYFRRLRFQASRRLKTRRQILMSSINMH